jgi:peptidoglycan glycosyltransferase
MPGSDRAIEEEVTGQVFGGERGTHDHLRARIPWRGGSSAPRLTTRGRMTVALGALLLGALLGVASARIHGSGAGSEMGYRPVGAAPGVAAGTGEEAIVWAPAEIVERLPGIAGQLSASHPDTDDVRLTSTALDPAAAARIVEQLPVPQDRADLEGPLRVEYSLDSELTRRIVNVLRRARVRRGHVIVLDPSSGRVLSYVSTDPDSFPPYRAYPAASLVKVVTAAAALDFAPEEARRPCRYRGNPYRLTRSRLKPPRAGRETSLAGALAMSNNQCFAQLAVNTLGRDALLAAIGRFGWLDAPAPGHEAGVVGSPEDDYALGRLGSGLAGSRITPLHAASLAASLATGESVEPWWVERVLDGRGKELLLPRRPANRRIMTAALAEELREMLARTTSRGTARSAFRDRRGRPKLGSIRVAGKTGNLSGRDPNGRYEWFIGTAPAEEPSVAVSVLQLHNDLWWAKSSQIAADVLAEVFCERGRCEPELAARYTGALGSAVAPVFLTDELAPARSR